MFKTMVEQMLKEYDDYKPGDLVRVDLWFGRVLEHKQPDTYRIQLATPDGMKIQELPKSQLSISYPVEFAMNWNGSGGNLTDILNSEEWDNIKANHPTIYRNCLEKVAMNTSYGSTLPGWIFDFLMSDKNTLKGKPATVLDCIKNAEFGPIMKYVNPGENLNDAVVRLMQTAKYITPDNRYVVMSY